MITLSHVRKEYAEVTPLKDINVTINKGEVISIIGPSGTGKSTLLRMINMLEIPTSGSIKVNDIELTDKTCDINKIRQKMGMVFQSFNLFEHMNVLDNICYAPMKLLGLSRQEAEAKAKELLKTVSLLDRAYAYPDELSGGQKQRAAIARTLAMDPEIILFDEPTSALDPTMVGEVLAVIRLLAQKGMTMIIVTHEMKFAEKVSTRVLYLDEGIVYEDGTPEQIFNNPTKEKTKKFITQVKSLKKDIKDLDSFDFLGFNSELENFARKNLVSSRDIYATHVVLEEVGIEQILRKGYPFKFLLEYSSKEDSLIITLEFDVKRNDPLKDLDPAATVILENVTDDNDIIINDSTIKLVFNTKK